MGVRCQTQLNKSIKGVFWPRDNARNSGARLAEITA
jgi:hypothetical protein